jgi:hypothetical protein
MVCGVFEMTHHTTRLQPVQAMMPINIAGRLIGS